MKGTSKESNLQTCLEKEGQTMTEAQIVGEVLLGSIKDVQHPGKHAQGYAVLTNAEGWAP